MSTISLFNRCCNSTREKNPPFRCKSDIVYLSSLRYDEEMAQSEMSDRDLRNRSGQSVGFKGNRARDPGKTGILTWK